MEMRVQLEGRLLETGENTHPPATRQHGQCCWPGLSSPPSTHTSHLLRLPLISTSWEWALLFAADKEVDSGIQLHSQAIARERVQLSISAFTGF